MNIGTPIAPYLYTITPTMTPGAYPLPSRPKPKLKPCPFCGSPVHWDDGVGIIHDKIRFNCIVDMVYPMESNMHIPKEMWIKKWNTRVDE